MQLVQIHDGYDTSPVIQRKISSIITAGCSQMLQYSTLFALLLPYILRLAAADY